MPWNLNCRLQMVLSGSNRFHMCAGMILSGLDGPRGGLLVGNHGRGRAQEKQNNHGMWKIGSSPPLFSPKSPCRLHPAQWHRRAWLHIEQSVRKGPDGLIEFTHTVIYRSGVMLERAAVLLPVAFPKA